MQKTTLSRSNNCHWIKMFLIQPPFTSHWQLPRIARIFSASVSSPTEICPRRSSLESKELMSCGRRGIHTTLYTSLTLTPANLTGRFLLFLRFLIDLDAISRSQTCTSIGCMLYCQRHPDLNIPTPVIYAYSCAYGSGFIAMEYIDGEI